MAKYGIYIIESLRSSDKYFDGENLSKILKLSGIENIYYWVKSVEEFINGINQFSESDYRYLHMSCHADENGIEINGETICNEKLLSIFGAKLKGKRLFMAACKGANKNLGYKLITDIGATSLIGTPINLRFDKSALFWPAFYHAINEVDKSRMIRSGIKITLRRCVQLFNIPIDYYSSVKNTRNRIVLFKFRQGKRTITKKLEITYKQISRNTRQ